MNVKYFVRTIQTRIYDYSQVDYVELVDKNPDFIQSFIDQLKIISEYDAVLLEDDLRLCKDFKIKIEQAIAEHPNDIINFFEAPYEYCKTMYKNKFGWNQCTYYPKGLAKKIADEMEHVRSTYNYEFLQYDQLESFALYNLKLKHLIYRPCLVQHIGGMSSLIGNPGQRATPYFSDYLDELGITYDEAERHLGELRQLMNIDIQEINQKGKIKMARKKVEKEVVKTPAAEQTVAEKIAAIKAEREATLAAQKQARIDFINRLKARREGAKRNDKN